MLWHVFDVAAIVFERHEEATYGLNEFCHATALCSLMADRLYNVHRHVQGCGWPAESCPNFLANADIKRD